MNKLEKAVAQLDSKGIQAQIENDTVYVFINDFLLELSDFEINFQSSEWIKENEPIEVGDEVITPNPSLAFFDLYIHSFVGTVIAIEDDIAVVEDGDGDCFSIEIYRLTKYNEED